jgi:hypothetical protein
MMKKMMKCKALLSMMKKPLMSRITLPAREKEMMIQMRKVVKSPRRTEREKREDSEK